MYLCMIANNRDLSFFCKYVTQMGSYSEMTFICLNNKVHYVMCFSDIETLFAFVLLQKGTSITRFAIKYTLIYKRICNGTQRKVFVEKTNSK